MLHLQKEGDFLSIPQERVMFITLGSVLKLNNQVSFIFLWTVNLI